MRPDSFIENGAPLAFNDARYSGLSAGVPGTVAGWDDGAAQATARGASARPGARHRRRPQGLRGRRDVQRADRRRTSRGSTTSRPRRRSTSTRTAPRATPATVLRNPDMARTYERSRATAPSAASTAARSPRRWSRAAQQPPHRADRRQDLAARPDDRARPAATTARSSASRRTSSYRGLDVFSMGPPSSGGSTVGEALNILEQIPGYDAMSDDRQAALLPRGVALRVRRPQRVRRRPGLLRRPAARAAVGLASRPSARALIGPTDRERRRSPAGDPCDAPARHRQARRVGVVFSPAQSTTHLTVADRHGMVVSLHVHDRVDRRQRHRRPGLGLPAQQRADRLQLRRPGPTRTRRPAASGRARRSPRPTSSATAGRSSPSARPAARRSSPRCCRSSRSGSTSARTLPQAIADPRASQRNRPRRDEPTHRVAGAGVRSTRYGHGARGARRTRSARAAEIGAATGIEFLPGGGFLAAAEPVRRGGGSAQVVRP